MLEALSLILLAAMFALGLGLCFMGIRLMRAGQKDSGVTIKRRQ